MQNKVPGWDDIIALWSHGRPESTMYIYRPVIAGFRNSIGSIPPQQVTLQQVQQYLDKFRDQLPATRKRKLCSLRSLFQFAYKIGAIVRDPTMALMTPHVPDELASRILNRDETLQLINAAETQRDKVLCMLLYAAGLRASEACNLRWSDCRQRGRSDGQISILGKGQKRRSIRLTPDMWKELNQLRTPGTSAEEPVFQSGQGFKRPLSRMHIANIVRSVAARAGLEQKVTPHWLRHCHATHAADEGCPLPLIQATLGHSNVATTSRYLHVNPEKSSTQYVSFATKQQTKRRF